MCGRRETLGSVASVGAQCLKDTVEFCRSVLQRAKIDKGSE